jgi:hypothetical protein
VAAGSSTPTFSRASAAYVQDHEGIQRQVLANEARFWGARRVENLVTRSQDFTNAVWNLVVGNTAATSGFADPFGGTSAQKLVDNATPAAHFVFQGGSGTKTAANRTWLWSVYLKAVDTGTAEVPFMQLLDGSSTHGVKLSINLRTGAIVTAGALIGSATNLVASAAQNTTTGWWRMWIGCTMPAAATLAAQAYVVFNNNASYAGTGTGFLVYGGQLEETSGQAVQTPAEYTSTNVLSSPFFGANVDGVRYLNTTLAGVAIPPTTLKRLMREPAATQLLATAAGLRNWTVADWTLGATMTRAFTSTGVDGALLSATRLTGGAVAGTNTILQPVAGVASTRTFSCYMRRITGTGQVRLFQGATFSANLNASLTPNVWVRVLLNASVDVSVLGVGVQIDTNGDAVDVDFGQFEAVTANTTTGTSFVSAAAAGSRSGELLSYVCAGNIVDAAGAAYAEFTSVLGDQCNAACLLQSTNNEVLAVSNFGAQGSVRDSVGAVTSTGGTTQTINVTRRVASKWSSGVAKSVTSTGSILATATGASAGNQGIGANLNVGLNGTGTIAYQGCLGDIRIFSTPLTDAQLNAVVA